MRTRIAGLESGMEKAASMSDQEKLMAKHILVGTALGGLYGGYDRYDRSRRKGGEGEGRFKSRRIRQALSGGVRGAGKGAAAGAVTGAIHSGRAKEILDQYVRSKMI